MFVFQQGPDAPAFSFPRSLLSLSVAFLARLSVCLKEKTASVHYIGSRVAAFRMGGFGLDMERFFNLYFLRRHFNNESGFCFDSN